MPTETNRNRQETKDLDSDPISAHPTCEILQVVSTNKANKARYGQRNKGRICATHRKLGPVVCFFFLYVYIYIHMYTHLYIRTYKYTYIYICVVRVAAHLSVYVSTFLPIHLGAYPSIYLSIHVSIRPSISPSVCLTISPLICLTISPSRSGYLSTFVLSASSYICICLSIYISYP